MYFFFNVATFISRKYHQGKRFIVWIICFKSKNYWRKVENQIPYSQILWHANYFYTISLRQSFYLRHVWYLLFYHNHCMYNCLNRITDLINKLQWKTSSVRLFNVEMKFQQFSIGRIRHVNVVHDTDLYIYVIAELLHKKTWKSRVFCVLTLMTDLFSVNPRR